MDFACINRIREHIVQFDADLVIAPLALGDHIDHRIAQAAARRVGIAAMAFYEDLPYAARLPDDAPLKRADTLNMALTPIEISAGDGYQWNQNCVRCYPSQKQWWRFPNTVRDMDAGNASGLRPTSQCGGVD